jgi:hypothetical protein
LSIKLVKGIVIFLFSGVAAPTNGSGAPAASAAPAAMTASDLAAAKASDDLLQLSGNPFANMLNGK